MPSLQRHYLPRGALRKPPNDQASPEPYPTRHSGGCGLWTPKPLSAHASTMVVGRMLNRKVVPFCDLNRREPVRAENLVRGCDSLIRLSGLSRRPMLSSTILLAGTAFTPFFPDVSYGAPVTCAIPNA